MKTFKEILSILVSACIILISLFIIIMIILFMMYLIAFSGKNSILYVLMEIMILVIPIPIVIVGIFGMYFSGKINSNLEFFDFDEYIK